ncbi:MAG TPA: DUF2652 domain-containing protein [Cyclobacteriaceae bacterium]|nr:DUF2652 domain-containing protein [Cyclobacteriaceae bacterium]
MTKGFLVLADITGFTPFVATTELEHSQEILQEMLKGIISFLTPTFRLAEVEGDAVFVYTDKLPRHDMILEIIESVYFNFRDKKASYYRIRTCHCKACEMASTLDLKFIVHYGDYVMNDAGGKKKPLGSSVNIAHRLLKNHVMDATGWTAYALFTKDCLDAIQTYPDNLHDQVEEYEHIGKVQTFSVNLDKQYQNYLSERRVYLRAEDADLVVYKDFPVPAPILWEWSNDPKKRTRWAVGSDWRVRSRPNRNTRRGGTNHCVNSKVIERILDYRPFQYYTSSMGRGPLNFTLTVRFEEIDSGTRLYWHVKMNGILPAFMTRLICKLIVVKGMQVHNAFERLLRLVEEESINSEVTA